MSVEVNHFYFSPGQKNSLSPDRLEEGVGHIKTIAKELGYDPFPMKLEFVPYQKMYEIGAYGLPGRFSHWTHGKEYERMKTMYEHGLSKIYELIINTNPSIAYLLENNSALEHMFVVAHCVGHADFFKNNRAYKGTDRQMDITSHLRADRIDAYEQEYGEKRVEKLLDAAL